MMKRLTALAAMITAMAVAGAAEAVTFTATFTGTIRTGGQTVDGGGLFGTAGAQLAGRTYSAVFTVDTSIPAYINSTSANFSNLESGSAFGAYTSPVTFAMSVQGLGTYTIGSANYDGRFQIADNPNQHVVTAGIQPSSAYLITMSLGADDSYDFLPDAFFGTAFSASVTSPNSNGTFSVNDMSFNTSVNSVTVAPASPSAVPAPATWAMMIVGFGLVGWQMRRGSPRPADCRA